MSKFYFVVRGVTFENRQATIAKINAGDKVRIMPEPSNPFDAQAHSVNVAFDGAVRHIGYVPKELVAQVAEFFDGEEFDGVIDKITGGFAKRDGTTASLGVVVMFEIPDDLAGDLSAGWQV